MGLSGGDFFLFEKRNISIDDCEIDLEGRRVTFYGLCSSTKTSDGRKFKSSLIFFKYDSGDNEDVMLMRSEVVGEAGQVKVRERRFMCADAVFAWPQELSVLLLLMLLCKDDISSTSLYLNK